MHALDVVGDVAGRVCVLVDDMIDTAGTICAAAEQLADHGAADVYAIATHAVLSDPATDRLKNSPISKVVVTNTLPLDDSQLIDKIEVLSVARIVADAGEVEMSLDQATTGVAPGQAAVIYDGSRVVGSSTIAATGAAAATGAS